MSYHRGKIYHDIDIAPMGGINYDQVNYIGIYMLPLDMLRTFINFTHDDMNITAKLASIERIDVIQALEKAGIPLNLRDIAYGCAVRWDKENVDSTLVKAADQKEDSDNSLEECRKSAIKGYARGDHMDIVMC